MNTLPPKHLLTEEESLDTRSCMTGLILAGGRGHRMGGADKGLQQLGGVTLVERVFHRLAPQCASIIISANRNLIRYGAIGKKVYPDIRVGFCGPLAGIETGLQHCITPWLMVVPCDVPYLPLNLVSQLSEVTFLSDRQTQAVFARTQEQNHPTICLLHRSLLPSLSEFLNQGQRQLMLWLEAVKARSVLFEENHAFCNFNTRDMLANKNHPEGNELL